MDRGGLIVGARAPADALYREVLGWPPWKPLAHLRARFFYARKMLKNLGGASCAAEMACVKVSKASTIVSR